VAETDVSAVRHLL